MNSEERKKLQENIFKFEELKKIMPKSLCGLRLFSRNIV